MKFVSIILSFYFFVLAVGSCCNDRNCFNEIKTTKIEQVTCHKQQEKGCDGECSPCCVCVMCVGFVVSSPLVLKHQHAFDAKSAVAFYCFFFTSVVDRSIWQPPKFS